LAFRIFVDTPGQDYHIGTAGKMSVDIDATPDLLLLIHHLRMDCRLLTRTWSWCCVSCSTDMVVFPIPVKALKIYK